VRGIKDSDLREIGKSKKSGTKVTFSPDEKRGRLRLVGSSDARESSVTIHQDVDLYAALLASGEVVSHQLGDDRIGWIQMVRGSASVDDQTLFAGDGLAVPAGAGLTISGVEDAELLLFDMGQMTEMSNRSD